MSDTIVEPREEVVVEQSTAAPAPDNDLDSLLAQWDATVGKAEPATDAVPEQNLSSEQTLNQQIADLLGPDPKVAELQGRVDSLRAEEYRRGELRAFNEMAADLQQHMPSWAPPDYAEAKLKALAHDQTISLAWELRNTDRDAAKQELLKVRWELMQPNTAADPKRVQELQQYGARLEIAVNANAILRKARLDIINGAAKLPKPIDEDATQVHMDVAAAVRGASAPITPEPPPDLSKMSDAELRRYTLENFGF